ncbi:MAG: hypothetical protein IH865_02975 [Chloroflexi bacterium]|nr:hypothetical protein [Chloroflexota bacterium]
MTEFGSKAAKYYTAVQMGGSIEALVRDFSEAIEKQIATTRFNVLILGPSMNGTNPAAVLRERVYEEAKVFGSVTGELRELVRTFRQKAGTSNLVDYEEELALHVDAIVLIPASSGSFAELGLFAPTEEICKKTLVLLSSEFRRHQSFVNLGPKVAYQQRGATVIHTDYAKVDSTWARVRRFLEVKRNNKIARERRIGTARA